MKTGFLNSCKWCVAAKRRERLREDPKREFAERLKYRYQLSEDRYQSLLNVCGGACLICKKVCKTGKRLAVDHNHLTGKIRGLLCMKCNRGIGYLDDSIDRLQMALDYLKEHDGK